MILKKIKTLSLLFVVLFSLITVLEMPLTGYAATPTISYKSELKMHAIDVGQGDCILLELPNGQKMLIDAGNSDNSSTIKKYLDSRNIKKIDYFIATHPHADHIGSAAFIVNNYSIGSIYAPKVSTTTKTFENFLLAVKKKCLKINTPVAGKYILNDKYKLEVQILAPNNTKYENLNDYSIVLKIKYRNISFLLTGDASIISEQEMIEKGFDLKATLLKIGHHGSKYSTSSTFLSKVSPKYTVISVGKSNNYGHPSQEIINRFIKAKVSIFRTDVSGTIIASSNGYSIIFNKKASPIKPQAPPSTSIVNNKTSSIANTISSSSIDNKREAIVYITKTGEKYHHDGCQYLRKSKIPIK